ncbi:MAG: efflux RND transporter periplasmic adaptor subunit [Gammaproteobacteria bacterium]
MRALHSVVAVVGIALAAGAAWWYQHRAPSAGQAVQAPAAGATAGGPVAVEVGRAESVTIDDAFSTVGTLRARQAVMLRPEVSGRVVTLGFVDGQRVRRGQLLVQLDDRLPAAQLQQAQAQASIARANLQRNRELAAQNFVSQSAVDQSQATLEVAEAQVALARAQLERMKIVAPFDGVAGIRSVNLGDYVKDGADLVAIEDTSALWVDYRLPERYVTRVRVGQTVEVALDAAPERRLSARIEALDAQVDAEGRSLLVRARMDNAGGTMRSGMFARTRTVFASRSQAIVVPEEALVPLGERQLLFKVVDGPGGKVSQRIDAKVGVRLPGKVEVLEGLREGDLVVVAGQARLLRGEALPLRVVEVGAAASAPAPAASGGVAPRRGGAAV